ncbi:hypothetical protein HY374_03500 [Candidatus Berkelbacteria bacterium]|nr:hypothetical protein [Candidatus Berkelbacteria bacterium]
MRQSLRFVCWLIIALWAEQAYAQGSGLVLTRNNDIQTLEPLTPPMMSLFDSVTVQLLGQQIPQPFQYTFYREPLAAQPGDGPLVLYQLNDSNQALFLFEIDNRIEFASFSTGCRQLDEAETRALINTIPALDAAYQRALVLHGISEYPAALVCEDALGPLSASVAPVLIGTDELLGLVFYRDVLDVATAYILVTRDSSFSFFNGEGGFRFDAADPNNPRYLRVDSNGDTITSASLSAGSTPTCEQINQGYIQCLIEDQVWDAYADAAAQEAFDWRAAVVGKLKCLASEQIAQAVGGPYAKLAVAMACAFKNGIEFANVIAFSAQALAHSCQLQIPPGTSCPAPASSACPTGLCVADGGDGFARCEYPPGTACTSTRNCGGPGYCNENGLCWTNPQPPEICDDYDNDCDLVVDDFSTSCGVGACRASGVCTSGGDSCIPGSPSPELCDNIDNDCDGSTDEDLGTTTCGVGACQVTVADCVGGVTQTCTPGTPSTEVCDGLDNDCDGTIDEGCSSSCLQVSGAGWVEAPDSLSLDVSGDLTIEFWAYMQGGSPCIWGGINNQCFPAVTKWRDGGFAHRGYFVDCRAVNGQIPRFTWSQDGGGFSDLYVSTVMPFNEWHHYAAVRQGSQMLFYIDGALVSSRNDASMMSIFNTPEPLRIGRGLLYDTDAYAIGQIDEVRVWNVARSQVDIQANRFSLTLPQSGLMGYWTFNEISGTAPDSSGNGNHGVFQGDAVRVPCSYP